MSKNQISYEIDNQVNKIYFARDIEDQLIRDLDILNSDKKIFFVYDKNISKKFINNLKVKLKLTGNLIYFKEIEGKRKNKNIKNLLSLFDELIKNKFTKNSVVLSCGGGVIGDMCGLLSSLYLRGTYYFHIPSTMTAIVDSCIGGKNGINYKNIINSLGSYYHPRRVYISEEVIKKLPNREYYSGFAEILKCGLIGNNKIIEILKKDNLLFQRKKIKVISQLILETLKTKIKFFKDDVSEKNQRLMLNFGHTFAHAIEMATDKLLKKDFLRHGEAVGLGMLCEIRLSNKNQISKNDSTYNLTKLLLKKFNLPTKLNVKTNLRKKIHSEIYQNIFLDKKKKNKYPRYIFLQKKGFPKIKEVKDFGDLNDVIYKILAN